MAFLPRQPSSIGEILTNSCKFYSSNLVNLLVYGLIISLLNIAVGMALDILMPVKQLMPSSDPLMALSAVIKVMAIVFVLSLPSLIFYMAMIDRIHKIEHNQYSTFSEGLSVGIKKFPAAVFAVVLYSLATVVGTSLLIVPGIILAVSLSFFLYFIVVLDFDAYSAVRASHRLVWGHWWRTNAVFALPSILLVVVFVGMGFLVAKEGLSDTDGGLDVAVEMLMAAVTPYFFVLGFVQFRDLQVRSTA